MCDKCEIDLAMYGEVKAGFSCSEATDRLLAEEANGIPRFASRKPQLQPGRGATDETVAARERNRSEKD